MPEIKVSRRNLSERFGDAPSVLFGYARASTGKQDLALQLDALEPAGCERIYTDTASGTIRVRPQLEACLEHLRVGDTLVVRHLERLGRSPASPDRDDRGARTG